MRVDTVHAGGWTPVAQRLEEHPGLILVIGEDAGRADLLANLEAHIGERQGGVVIRTAPSGTAAGLYGALLARLGSDCQSPLKSRQFLAVEESLARLHSEGRRPVLLVDDAHRLSAQMLEEIRLCLNMQTATDTLIDIVMAGGPELFDVLRCREFRHLKQRVGAYYTISHAGPGLVPHAAPAGPLSGAARAAEPLIRGDRQYGLILALVSAAAILAGAFGLLSRRPGRSRKAALSCITDITA